MDSYLARAAQKQKAQPLMSGSSYGYLQGWLKRGLPPESQAGVPPTNAVAASRVGRPPPAPATNRLPAVKTASSNVVHVTRFWNMPSDSTFDFFASDTGFSPAGGKFREKDDFGLKFLKGPIDINCVKRLSMALI